MKRILGSLVKNVQEALEMSVGTEEQAKLDRISETAKKPPEAVPLKQTPKEPAPSQPPVNPRLSLEVLLQSDTINQLESHLEWALSQGGPSGRPMKNEMRKPILKPRSETYKTAKSKAYNDAIRVTAQIYKRLADGQPVRYEEVKNIVQNFYHTLVTDKNVLLLLSSLRENLESEDYLYTHAVNVCLLSMVLPVFMGYSKKQVLEIGEAALLADVGMEYVPKHLTLKKGRLNKDDLYEIHKHPVLGCHLLEGVQGITEKVYLAAYQHHERASGGGYPKNRQGNLIHSYAQIISVADVYAALSAKRAYREAKIPYEAMKELLKMGKVGLLNTEKVRHFITHMSLFPVGSMVLLSSGRIGRVICSNMDDFTKPIVAVISDEDKQPLQGADLQIINLAESSTDSISMALPDQYMNVSLFQGF